MVGHYQTIQNLPKRQGVHLVVVLDSETGFLTGVPNTIGQFVVGICVEEYRDGNLISTTRRDFQYNVHLNTQIFLQLENKPYYYL